MARISFSRTSRGRGKVLTPLKCKVKDSEQPGRAVLFLAAQLIPRLSPKLAIDVGHD